MEQKKKKSISYYMRSLHRDIGFFIIGLTIIFGVSGVVLVYRDTNFLKQDVLIEKNLAPNIEASELGNILHIRDLKISKEEGELIYFQNGTYNKATGVATYTNKELPSIFNKLNKLHKTSSKGFMHWVPVTFGVLMLFLAISSLWMINPKSKLFRRSIILTGAGILFSILLLFLIR